MFLTYNKNAILIFILTTSLPQPWVQDPPPPGKMCEMIACVNVCVCVRVRERVTEKERERERERRGSEQADAAVGQSVLTSTDMKFSKLKGAPHATNPCTFSTH